MSRSPSYTLVALRNGARAIFASAYGEAMHPVAGPAEEAERLYVTQLRLRERLQQHQGEFVIWDVGLGAAANALAALRATRDFACPLRLVSFDNTLEPLAFALESADALGYLKGYEPIVGKVLTDRYIEFVDRDREVRWQVMIDDFPGSLADCAAMNFPTPNAIFYDAFSPARNPEMWTLPVFERLFGRLNPEQPCTLATYSRSTMVRVTLLLAGFFVGRGQPSGVKEETTVAANTLQLLGAPLGVAWLKRAQKSGSAEPLRDAIYQQVPLSDESWQRLQAHPQFVSGEQPQAGADPPPAATQSPRKPRESQR